ncbi:2-phosphosulfolactate phosphatase [Cellulomonas fimi]|uniref:Probable 2-phosphosulfolactate phosphatase n=1 Tax=Cellulomonas fimi (strain ATCC 484 / DSM 20113 / JCM 1341 / CCUG 24087 / LMG 16345 / NBRC 15513 / NCIMB 8980 / NCTC 7547 / NRS-133) TaxID=590998 RepID=F4H1L6_CELFA|nr:2-phosphosulfolactate phosphatase [Cellulomonas fimi]AEE46315.1 putative lipoprotein [Cellulomonas fimi ATCC 484]NNH08495.1 2-phosphosulfolactate phosphatase [Cellulomonas fimi]VEH32494.1 Probable 2-phosphosulfolactate phosphatase [Cellulomonas fimi]
MSTTTPRLDVRLVWGPSGARSLDDATDVAVVVDVLSFTTTVTVAADRSVAVVPHATGGPEAAALAASQGAVLAARRSTARPGEVSLSPGSVRRAARLHRLVLPSPNGSTLSSVLDERVGTVVAACLRNAGAVAGWLVARAADTPLRVAAVAAGERRTDGTVRHAPEDVWGAGAVLAHLRSSAGAVLSPQARAAADAWLDVAPRVGRSLRHSRTGVELVEWGYAEDVEIAAEVDASASVPLLRDGAYVDVAAPAGSSAPLP